MAKLNLFSFCLLVMVICIRLPVVKTACPAGDLLSIGCSCINNQVHCPNKGLTRVPTNIPSSTTFLALGVNKIRSLPSGVFDSLPNLEILFLYDNEIEEIESEAFKNLDNLRILDLQANKIRSLPFGVFDSLPNLEKLDLEDNNISSLPSGVFDSLPNLEKLDLEENNIRSLPSGVFDSLTNLEKLFLESNPFECCSSQWLIEYGKTKFGENGFELFCTDFGQSVSYESFNTKRCPVDGQWSEWTDSGCSTTCGQGTVTKTRNCDNPPPSNGGDNCSGAPTETETCNLGLCPACKSVGGVCRSERSKCKLTLSNPCNQRHHVCCKIAGSNKRQDSLHL